jgi:hypothetical protein
VGDGSVDHVPRSVAYAVSEVTRGCCATPKNTTWRGA